MSFVAPGKLPRLTEDGMMSGTLMGQSWADPHSGPRGPLGLDAMRRFVSERNIERYRNLLRSEINDERRRMLRALLDEEERRLVAIDETDDHADGPPDAGPDGGREGAGHKPD
jgi:hypothetical protein